MKLHFKLLVYFKRQLTTGHERSLRAKKNIIYSIFIKGISILISLMMVPITLDYLNNEEYGVWLTLSSLLAWIGFFDIGLGNGLRNKLTEAITIGDYNKGRVYISTTFALLAIVIACIFLLFSIINPFLDWSGILNTKAIKSIELGKVVYITFAFFCMQFILKTAGIVYMSYQRSAMADLINVLASGISLVIIYILTKTTQGSLLYVAATFSSAPVIIYFITYYIVFYSTYKELKPTFSSIKFQFTKELLGLGVQFFIIQIASVITFLTANIIIAQFLGPEQVTIYNIAYKYFSIVIMGFTIIVSPLWNAYTEAFAKGDIKWIKNSLQRTFQIWIITVLVTAFMLIMSPNLYRLWIGDKVLVPFSLSVACFLYMTLYNWNNITSFFLYGVGKIKVQFYLSIFSSLLFLPLSIYLVKTIGINGVLYAMISFLTLSAIIQPILTYKILIRRQMEIVTTQVD